MTHDNSTSDPFESVRALWQNLGFPLPGIVTPTLDSDELDKRIANLKTVENWLKMNLNMLQLTTQGLEVQRATLAALRSMGERSGEDGAAANFPSPEQLLSNATAMWPWKMFAEACPPEMAAAAEAVFKTQTTPPKKAKTKPAAENNSAKTGAAPAPGKPKRSPAAKS